ncbi:MAG: RNase P subunit p30 family protein [Thaumarchaeota archaeon]|nr:RNase P subunit p30 family protein [Candidatus Calditenuaceae archaeon]MDW8042427.1 RNase P subunit p30 family protein [Nitrososphaerota archaeon]
MRRYYDLGLAPRSHPEANALLAIARESGFHGVAVEGPDATQVERDASPAGFEVFSRITLRPASTNELYRELRRMRWRYHVVAVEAHSRELFMAALRDSRVDLVVAPVNEMIVVDRHVSEVARNAVELRFSDFLTAPERFLTWLIRSGRWIERERVPVVVTSGAVGELGVRRPLQLASVLAGTGFGVGLALKSVSETPGRMVVENARRLSGLSDPRGVWSVEDEEEISRD